MNQTCKVCGEPAAGFHFGAFTCEGCKSFFGRSYNNLSSISECKNNGECVINKKNRTACKACRLRKCLLVGMSKSGSRYGRRSNWFKIHCLLQEQHQQAAVHGIQKSSSSSAASLAMLGHPGAFASGMYGTRPNCSKEELMLLGLEEYKPNVASPSVSSPDSHNSDSSVDLNIRSNNSMRLGKATDAAQNLGKDIFLQLPFPSLATLPVMPPPGLFPPSHLLFAGYHPSLYPHHQNLLRNPADRQIPHLMNSSNSVNNSNHYGLLRNSYNNNGRSNNTNSDSSCSNNIKLKESGSAEELSKCFYLDAVLKSSQESSALLKTSDGNSQIESKSKRIVRIPGASSEIEGENHDIDPTGVAVVMTPPRSPSEDIQNNPIDLSMKGESMSCKSDTPSIDYNRNLSGCESDAFTEDEDEISITTAETTIQKRRQSSDMDTTGTGSNIGDYNLHTEDGIETPCESDLKRMKMQVITPVDLTTKF